jgi:hypothetical protein
MDIVWRESLIEVFSIHLVSVPVCMSLDNRGNIAIEACIMYTRILQRSTPIQFLQDKAHRVHRVLALSAFDIFLNKYYSAG